MLSRSLPQLGPYSRQFPGITLGTFQDIPRQQLPTPGAADAYAGNCRIHSLTIHNNGVVNSNITVHDKQGSPMPIIPDQTLPPGGFVSFASEVGEYCSGGFTWGASTANVIGSAVIEK